MICVNFSPGNSPKKTKSLKSTYICYDSTIYISDVPALFWAQPGHCGTGGGSEQPGQPAVLGRGEAGEGGGGFAGEGGEGSPAAAAAELKRHKWQFGRGALASEGVHRYLR